MPAAVEQRLQGCSGVVGRDVIEMLAPVGPQRRHLGKVVRLNAAGDPLFGE